MSPDFIHSVPDELSFIRALHSNAYDAACRLSSRILIENVGIEINKFPIGGNENIDNITNFIPQAMEGFILTHKTKDLRTDKDDAIKILAIGKEFIPENIWGELIKMNINTNHLESIKDEIGNYHQALTVLCLLAKMGKVNYESLDLGNLKQLNITSEESFWPHSLTKEDIWFLFARLQETTKEMLFQKSIKNDADALRTAHFFAASFKIASQLLS